MSAFRTVEGPQSRRVGARSARAWKVGGGARRPGASPADRGEQMRAQRLFVGHGGPTDLYGSPGSVSHEALRQRTASPTDPRRRGRSTRPRARRRTPLARKVDLRILAPNLCAAAGVGKRLLDLALIGPAVYHRAIAGGARNNGHLADADRNARVADTRSSSRSVRAELMAPTYARHFVRASSAAPRSESAAACRDGRSSSCKTCSLRKSTLTPQEGLGGRLRRRSVQPAGPYRRMPRSRSKQGALRSRGLRPEGIEARAGATVVSLA